MKTLATILMVAASAQASEQALLITKNEIKAYEAITGNKEILAKLNRKGALVLSNIDGIYVVNATLLNKSDDEESIKAVSDLVNFTTNERIRLEKKDWQNMYLSTQDYKAGM